MAKRKTKTMDEQIMSILSSAYSRNPTRIKGTRPAISFVKIFYKRGVHKEFIQKAVISEIEYLTGHQWLDNLDIVTKIVIKLCNHTDPQIFDRNTRKRLDALLNKCDLGDDSVGWDWDSDRILDPEAEETFSILGPYIHTKPQWEKYGYY